MKNISLLFVLILFSFSGILKAQTEENLVDNCALSAGDNTTYLKDYIIKLPEAKSRQDIPVFKATIILVKNTRYRFSLCNANNSEGEGIIQLYDQQRRLATSYIEETGKMYDMIDFPCKKTGQYSIWYTFKEGEKGLAVGIVSMVKPK